MVRRPCVRLQLVLSRQGAFWYSSLTKYRARIAQSIPRFASPATQQHNNGMDAVEWFTFLFKKNKLLSVHATCFLNGKTSCPKSKLIQSTNLKTTTTVHDFQKRFLAAFLPLAYSSCLAPWSSFFRWRTSPNLKQTVPIQRTQISWQGTTQIKSLRRIRCRPRVQLEQRRERRKRKTFS